MFESLQVAAFSSSELLLTKLPELMRWLLVDPPSETPLKNNFSVKLGCRYLLLLAVTATSVRHMETGDDDDDDDSQAVSRSAFVKMI